LIVGQAHIRSTGLNQGVGVGMPEGIHHRGVGSPNGVVSVVVAVAPTIKDAQHNWGDAAAV